jgi:putative DNA primase/helicase
MKAKTRESARGKWLGILTEHGIESRYLRNVHGPCPLCNGKDRFRYDDNDGAGTFFCNSCGAGDGMKLLMMYTGMDFAQAAMSVDRIVTNIQTQPRRKVDVTKATERLKRIASQLRTLDGLDTASTYLKNRGINTAPCTHLKWHPSLPYFEGGEKTGSFPALVGALRWPNGSVETFHATYITHDGTGKAPVLSPKKILGKRSETIHGCAIRLTGVGKTIGICEGIENALAVMQMCKIRCWAAYSSAAMAEFVPPEGVTDVAIFPDADKNFVGQHAATTLAVKLSNKGYRVKIAPFLDLGMDYNDLLIQRLREGKTI